MYSCRKCGKICKRVYDGYGIECFRAVFDSDPASALYGASFAYVGGDKLPASKLPSVYKSAFSSRLLAEAIETSLIYKRADMLCVKEYYGNPAYWLACMVSNRAGRLGSKSLLAELAELMERGIEYRLGGIK